MSSSVSSHGGGDGRAAWTVSDVVLAGRGHVPLSGLLDLEFGGPTSGVQLNRSEHRTKSSIQTGQEQGH